MAMDKDLAYSLKVESYDDLVHWPGVRICTTTRRGGISQGPFESLNLGFNTTDVAELVVQNRRMLSEFWDFDLDKLICGEQIHGKRVSTVRDDDCGRGALSLESALPATDGLVSATRGVVLAITTADCVPVFLFDPLRHAIGLIHAGWRGIALEISKEAVQVLVAEFGSNSEQLQALLGVAIGPCCYEVSHDVFEKMGAFGVGRRLEDGKYKLDLRATIARQLWTLGIPQENILSPGLCTACKPEDFYSARRDVPITGRMLSLMMLE